MASLPRVVQITSRGDVAEAEILARVRPGLAVQLRDLDLSARERLRFGLELRARTREAGAMLLVNDRMDLALAIEADGVHLGGGSVSVSDARRWFSIVSVACHAAADVVVAAEQGADLALLAPIFATPGKGPALGVAAIAEARGALDANGLSIAVYALGGVTGENARLCIEAGAAGVASIRSDLGSTLLGGLAT